MSMARMTFVPRQFFFWMGLMLFLVAAFPMPAAAQDRRPRRMRGPPRQEEPAVPVKREDTTDKKDDRYFALLGGDLYTVTGPVLRDTDILVKNGVIDKMSRDVELPDGCETLEVKGMRVYPGLIAVTSAGILGREPPEHGTDLYSLNMVLALAGGLTTVVTGDTAAKLTYGTTEGMVVKRNLFTSLSYSRRSPANRQVLRNDLAMVRRYLRDLEAYEAGKSSGVKDLKEPDKSWLKGKYEGYLKLLQGETVAKVSASGAQDLREICDLAVRFGFRLVIFGGTEAWILPDVLGRADVQMVITPRSKASPISRKAQPTGWSIELANILYESGVNFAVLPSSSGISLGGITGRDLLALPMEAAFAVRGGLPEEEAIKSITINAARVLGLDGRIGSIEEGKDGDFIVCDGDLLHYNTLVQWTIVNGRVAYDKEKESLFAHIRPRDGSEKKVIEFWPRPFDAMPVYETQVEDEEPPKEEQSEPGK